ncbi:endonuclease domain-containing protein [Actinoplanes sp. NPDC051411]|uniref:endonuclease domain-containing protein n=1 Tax=Actinoplanes sp. NPDC051411 TaxID=3155522 RepID=UPI003445D841
MERLTTTQKGYGWAHQRARQRALAAVEDGTACSRCGGPMWRAQARLLDLDHTDDRRGYRGLAHRACNRRAGQAKGMLGRTRATSVPSVTPQPTPRSRNW